jgi:hypothetical protein
MSKRRWRLAIGAAGLAAVAIAVVLATSLTDGGETKRGGATTQASDADSTQLSHADYARLWKRTRVGESKSTVLARWPKKPYQHYSDNLKDDCFEWLDKPLYLYNLCFKGGVLRSKSLF